MNMQYAGTETVANKQSSPYETLINQFMNQNEELCMVVEKAGGIANKLSSPEPIPEPDIMNKPESPRLPFSSGLLMDFHNQLVRNQKLTYDLQRAIDKIRNLI